MLVIAFSSDQVDLSPRGCKRRIDRHRFGWSELSGVLPVAMPSNNIRPVPTTARDHSGVNQDFTASVSKFHGRPSEVREILT